MNIRDLLNRLGTLEEGLTMKDVNAAVQNMTSDQDRATALAGLATQNQLGGLYDPVSGYFVSASGQISSTADKNTDFKLSNMGLIPSNAHTSTMLGRLFGTSGKDYDAQLRAQSGKVNADRTSQEVNQANLKKLFTLVDQLKSIKPAGGGQDPMPSPTPTPTPTPGPGPGPAPTPKEKTLGQQAGIGAGIVGGGAAGYKLAQKAGLGTLGKLGATAIGGAAGGLGVNAIQKEGVELDLSIAQALTESFGYEYNEQLDEYSMDQFGKDAGDFGRGAWNGVTLGTGDNIAAGVQSAFGKDTYKQALAKQTAASKEAETRSPWLYGAGNVAGSIAAPIPGGAVAQGLVKGGKLAKGAVALGTNMAAQAGVDALKGISDKKTLGYDPSKYPTTPQEVKAFQQANGLTPDGVAGPKTKAVLAKMGLTPPTVAESIKSLQDRLSMIESGEADYQVWLMEDGTVIGEQGEVITDEQIISEVNWGALAGDAWKGIKGIGSNFAGGLGGKAVQGTAKTADEIAAMQAARTAAGKKALHPSQVTNLGLDTKMPTKAQSMANTLGQKIHMNPGKAALGAAALGAGGMALAKGAGGQDPAPTGTTTGGGGGGGGGDTGENPATPATTTPATTTPATTTPEGPTPEQQAIIDQIREVMGQLADVEDVGIQRALSDAQATIDAVSKQAPAKPVGDKAKDPAKNPDAATSIPSGGLENPANQIKVPAGTTINKMSGDTKIPANVAESDELARWLKIARG